MIKQIARTVLRPFREALGKFVILSDVSMRSTVFYRAGTFIAHEKISGDFLEFGAFRGDSFIAAFHAIRMAFKDASISSDWNTPQEIDERRERWQQMRFVAFDSFQGLPNLLGLDQRAVKFAQGRYAYGRAKFEANITRAGVPPDRTIIVPGWFTDTLTDDTRRTHGLRHAAIVHVDSDLYKSAKLVLEFVTPLLTDGTIIVFDDWYCFRGHPELGEQRAWREWIASHPDWVETDFQQGSFIVNRRMVPADIARSAADEQTGIGQKHTSTA